MAATIRTILFDMGNVLLHFSHPRMCEQLGLLCGRTQDELHQQLITSGRQLDFERGHYSAAGFHEWFQSLSAEPIDLLRLRHSAADIFELNTPMLPILDGLKRHGYRLVLLSNTSVYHFEHVRENYDVLDRFDAYVLSYEANALKPEPAIFEAALRVIDCAPPECFYTDDIPAYVEAGRSHGLDAEVFTTPEALTQHFTDRGVRWQNGVL